MPLFPKTMEVQIKGYYWNKRFRTVQVYWLAWSDFHALVFRSLYYPWGKMGTTLREFFCAQLVRTSKLLWRKSRDIKFPWDFARVPNGRVPPYLHREINVILPEIALFLCLWSTPLVWFYSCTWSALTVSGWERERGKDGDRRKKTDRSKTGLSLSSL